MEKKIHVPSMVLSIIGLLFSLLLPIVTYPCSIVALVMSVNNKAAYKTKPQFIIAIIGLILAAANSILGVVLQMQLMGAAQ